MFLVIDAEEGLAIFTICLILINEFVESVEIYGGCAIYVVPPIANEVLLIENGSVRA